MRRIVAAVFHAPAGPTEPERFVEAGKRASAEDLIRALRPAVEEVLIVTGDATWAGTLDATLVRTAPERPFHLGEELQRLADTHRIDALLYFGSGAGGLLSAESIDDLRAFAERDEPGALFNNYYSCDFAVVSDAASLSAIDLPVTDNALGFALADAGIPCHALPRSVETAFDIDTPTDLVLLASSGRGGPTLRAFLEARRVEHPTLDAVCERLTDRTRIVHITGRVNPVTWAAFVPRVACRTAGIVEGRGMRAYGDQRPLLVQRLLRDEGPIAFIERLAEAADAAILDTRPLLAVDGALPAAADRFASDLYLAEQVADPTWRAFTEAAAKAPIPLLLGGHSLVSGGLYLLAEVCWKGQDLARRLHPDPFRGRNDRT
jgi:hypothetical protein